MLYRLNLSLNLIKHFLNRDFYEIYPLVKFVKYYLTKILKTMWIDYNKVPNFNNINLLR